jgi:8-oxo-dGTP pyrophosphatase MutT (NUDIX family)
MSTIDPNHNPWTRLSRRTVYENQWIVVHHDQVLRPDGRPGIYGVVHFQNKAVGVLALDAQARVLLVGQYRYPLDQYSWEIPEGGASTGETPLEAAQRELQEETGYEARCWRELLRAHLSNSISDEEAIAYLATDLTPGPALPEGTEQLQVKWVPLAEVMGMIDRGELTDALSLLALQRLVLMRAAKVQIE